MGSSPRYSSKGQPNNPQTRATDRSKAPEKSQSARWKESALISAPSYAIISSCNTDIGFAKRNMTGYAGGRSECFLSVSWLMVWELGVLEEEVQREREGGQRPHVLLHRVCAAFLIFSGVPLDDSLCRKPAGGDQDPQQYHVHIRAPRGASEAQAIMTRPPTCTAVWAALHTEAPPPGPLCPGS